MTDDPITAALQQLADHHDQLTQLTELITGIGDTLREHQAALEKLAETPPTPTRTATTPSPPPAWWKLAAADRAEPIARLHAWVEQVYRPGYGHLAATLAPCWSSHDLCLYGLDILSDLWSVLYLQPERTPRTLSAQAEYQARILPALAAQLTTETTRCGHTLPHLRQDVMTDATLRQALAYARRGWPVFPCLPGQKIPATTHGYKDATTDEQQITEWFGRGQRWNLAIATGTPGPDVLDIDQHGQAGNGYPAFARLAPRRTGQRRRRLRTDPGRRNARLLRRLGPAQWPPAQPPPRLPRHRRLHPGPALPGRRQALPLISRPGGHGTLDWAAVTALLEPQRHHEHPAPGHAADRRLEPAGPLGRPPARRQPQRRPVLGRQPRPGRQPRRRPEPARRRRPPGRPRRTGNHPHPRLRPPHPPARSPGRGDELR